VSDPVADARLQWGSARRAAQAVLREPGDLPERERALLRVSVLPQIEAALAALDEGFTLEELVRWNSFLPDAIASLAGAGRLDPGLESARDHMRRGLEALEGGVPGR
jgi:hypothetical protein